MSVKYNSLYGYMNVLFMKDTVQGQFSEREEICLWLMPANLIGRVRPLKVNISDNG